MRKIGEIKRKLKKLEPSLKERFKVKRIGIFGSYIIKGIRKGEAILIS